MTGRRFSKEELANGPPEKLRIFEVCVAIDTIHGQQSGFKEIVYAHLCEFVGGVLYFMRGDTTIASFKEWMYWKEVGVTIKAL